MSCMADPRCRSDFPQDEKDRIGLSEVKGLIPSWKMVTLTFVSRTSCYNAYVGSREILQWALKSQSSWEWGQRDGDGFTFNTLSHDWIVSWVGKRLRRAHCADHIIALMRILDIITFPSRWKKRAPVFLLFRIASGETRL